MSQNKTTETQNAAILEELMAQGDIEPREFAELLLEREDEEERELAVFLLEDCVAHGDTDAMVMLAKCCALAHGMEHNAERAEALVSEAAEKGNYKARLLMHLINDWKGQKYIALWGL